MLIWIEDIREALAWGPSTGARNATILPASNPQPPGSRVAARRAALVSIPPPVTAPALPTPHVYKRRYGRMYCEICNLDSAYCPKGGHTSPDLPSQDGADSSLSQRIIDVVKGRGTCRR